MPSGSQRRLHSDVDQIVHSVQFDGLVGCYGYGFMISSATVRSRSVGVPWTPLGVGHTRQAIAGGAPTGNWSCPSKWKEGEPTNLRRSAWA